MNNALNQLSKEAVVANNSDIMPLLVHIYLKCFIDTTRISNIRRN